MTKWILVTLAACIPLGPSPRFATRHAEGSPQNIAGELRPGDDRCTNLCDHHTLTWATAGRVHLELSAPSMQAFLEVKAGSGTKSGEFGHTSSIDLDVEAGIDYDVAVNAYNYTDRGPYTLEVTPAPSREKLAEERPVPKPPTPEQTEPDDALPAKIATATEGFTRVGSPMHADLAKVPTMKWHARRGRCYLAIAVLEAGARKNDDWYVVSAKLVTSSEVRSTNGGFLLGSQRVIAAGSKGDLCPSRDGSFEIAFEDHFRLVPLAHAGTGGFRVQLYDQPIATKRLDERDHQDDRDYCTSCSRQRLACQHTGDTGHSTTCEAQFSDCLYQGGMSRAQCSP